jgi:hypothetical protein
MIAVRNDLEHPLVVVRPDGSSETLAPAAWDRFQVAIGDALKLPGGTCLVARGEPTLAVIGKQ